ncbi:MAG: formylmethanofuran dehydrogenase subunit A [Pirellulaceae bacterium]
MAYILIANGTLYDPANGIDGLPSDVWLRDGKVVAPPTEADPTIDRRIDATGYVVMPGGVDLHCHIVGPKVNFGRQMTPEFRREGQTLRRPGVRSATGGLIPSSWGTGYMFSGLGYTTAMDAAIPGLLARHAHEELQDTPLIDKGFYLLFGNNHFVMDRIREGRTEELDTYLGWSLEATKAFAVKIVNPGGVENWKQVCRKTIQQLEQPVPSFGVSPREIVRQLASSVDRLGLPHALHIHCNNLGVPGNFETTLHTMQALEGHRGHFAHTQFHSYAGDPDDPASFRSAAPQLAEYINDHPEISIDVGHVNPGQTLGMTGDAPFAHFLAQLSGNRWFAADCELESSCGIIPMEFHPQKVLVHAVQWAAALEWYLLVKNPWQLAMSSDHPNGGAIFRYPEIIHLLMDNAFRQEALARMHPVLGERSCLAELTREYTLSEIAIITRAAPARILGLKSKGHLGVGADADLTIYTPNTDIREMFSRPRYVIQNGALVCSDGEILSDTPGRTFTTAAPYDSSDLAPIRSWFDEQHTVRFRNFAIEAETLIGLETVASHL